MELDKKVEEQRIAVNQVSKELAYQTTIKPKKTIASKQNRKRGLRH